MQKIKKKNKGIFILGVIFLFVVIFLAFQLFFREKLCPDKFYDNQTPRICLNGDDCRNIETRYYLKNGERINFSQYNQYYVMFICAVPPSVLYGIIN